MKVNAHLHTPYSFSAFDSIAQALDMAAGEGVKVVGINDFYTTDGYAEWQRECAQRKLFPLYNIEFISLQAEDQAAGIRVNDPNHPGRTYLSGKGLCNPPQLREPYKTQFADVRAESNAHVERMCAKLNELLASVGAGFTLDVERIERELTKGSIRERHLAKALRLAAAEKTGGDAAALSALLSTIFGGKAVKSDPGNPAALENEIRNNLLKAGGAAFVPEDPKAFLPLADVCKIILDAGGLPTYPFLADDAAGNFTDFEADIVRAAATLKARGIASVEFITTRNSVEVLERYAGYLHEAGFVVTFGSEHNTPAMEPIELKARGGVPLTDKLLRINYEGACVVAAHQDRMAKGEKGYVSADQRDEFIEYGDRLIRATV
jgi:predicted metal-dependent phosphoesterase TrpH